MRQNPSFTLASEEGVKRLVREHPFPVLRIEAGHLTAGEPLPMTA